MLELLLIVAQLAQNAGASVYADLALEATPALGGFVHADSATEIRITAIAERAMRVRVKTTGSSPEVELDLDLPAGVPVSAWLPAYPAFGDEPLSLRAFDRQGAQLLAAALDYVPTSRRMQGLLGMRVGNLLPAGRDTVLLDASAMPRFAAVYGHFDLLAADATALARLDHEQLAALTGHVANCGRVLILGAGARTRQLLRAESGCDGRYLRFADEPGELLAARAELAALAAPATLADLRLSAALATISGRPDGIRAVLVLLPASLLVFLMLFARPERRRLALSFGLLATLLVPLAWSTGPSSWELTWAEAPAGAELARYVRTTRFAAGRRAEVRLPARADAKIDERPAPDRLLLHWDRTEAGRHFQWRALPLESVDIAQAGWLPIASTLRSGREGEDLVVCNPGSDPSRPALLVMDGRLFEVPSLEPGETWRPSDESRRVEDMFLLALVRERALPHAVALLHELPEFDNGWLLRYEPPAAGVSPC